MGENRRFGFIGGSDKYNKAAVVVMDELYGNETRKDRGGRGYKGMVAPAGLAPEWWHR